MKQALMVALGIELNTQAENKRREHRACAGAKSALVAGAVTNKCRIRSECISDGIDGCRFIAARLPRRFEYTKLFAVRSHERLCVTERILCVFKWLGDKALVKKLCDCVRVPLRYIKFLLNVAVVVE